MFEKYNSEDLKNMVEIINFMKKTGTDINSISKAKETKSDKTEEIKEETTVNKEEEIIKKMKEVQDVAWEEELEESWEKVLENRKNNPEHRWMKNQGRKPTIEDLDNIIEKMEGWDK
jgi:DNA-binding transcriptional MerR regulator